MSEKTYQRVDLAIEQLDTALELFLSERSYASALTLAGAAEEILGQAISQKGQQDALRYKYDVLNSTHRELHGKTLEWKRFSDGENHARNALKHMRSRSEDTVTTDLQEAAIWMLVRACANYGAMDFARTDRMDSFDNWFYEHVVGV
jgi:hypothetical protein